MTDRIVRPGEDKTMTWNGSPLPNFTVTTVHTEDPLAVQLRVLTRTLNEANDEIERLTAERDRARDLAKQVRA